jgi:hypothetical protein
MAIQIRSKTVWTVIVDGKNVDDYDNKAAALAAAERQKRVARSAPTIQSPNPKPERGKEGQ